MKKKVGYLLIGLGLLGLVLSYEGIQNALNITLPTALDKTTLLPLSGGLIIIGAFIAFRLRNTSKKVTEVPIYHDKDIVGYRRIQK